MPLEDIKPDTFQQACQKAQMKCLETKGDLMQLARAIRRARELMKTAPWIVEAVLEKAARVTT
jgi:hypothetical protein